jgi:hypothetical protein
MSKNIKFNYEKWCKDIAEQTDLADIVAHFREHVSDHFDRYDRTEEGSFETWLVGVINFSHILQKKFPNITDKDLLFKLCMYYQWSGKGPKPSFDDKKFVEKYQGIIKKIQSKTKA